MEHTERGTLGVNLESPTLLTIGEAASGLVTGRLAENCLFMGGEYGATERTSCPVLLRTSRGRNQHSYKI